MVIEVPSKSNTTPAVSQEDPGTKKKDVAKDKDGGKSPPGSSSSSEKEPDNVEKIPPKKAKKRRPNVHKKNASQSATDDESDCDLLNDAPTPSPIKG